MANTKSVPKEPKVELDFNNVMADILKSDQGLTIKEINKLKPEMTEAHKDLMQRRKNEELPFYDLPFQTQELKSIRRLADDIRKRTENFVVLGIGGSALGTRALFKALSPHNHNLLESSKRRFPRLFVVDNIDPETLTTLLNFVDPRHTFFNIVTKSGTTTETISQFMIVHDRLRRSLGRSSVRDHVIVTTDSKQGFMRELVNQEDYHALEVPEGVGGRFSVLSPVSLLPLAVTGINVVELLKGAVEASKACTHANMMRNPAYLFAALNFALRQWRKRSILVMMPYADALMDFAEWFNQLWAESLGKQYGIDGKEVLAGQTPVKALGATDQHSQLQLYMEGPEDKVVVFVGQKFYRVDTRIPSIFKENEGLAYLGGYTLGELIQTEQAATARALTMAGRPNMTLTIPRITPASMGYLMYLLEVAAVASGYLYKIDPFDQPGVELSKKFTYGLMGRPGFESFKEQFNRGNRPKKKYII
ncbi:MAG: glucose-6-phosphate isomerase [Deltaproteobacteria bacterium]|nr:glucose-6-phosphate isomerase [Deltaproteobacteria bacterium]